MPRTVKLNLVGVDSNIFSVIGTWAKQARREKWTKEDIKQVTDEAMDADDYNHALSIIIDHCDMD